MQNRRGFLAALIGAPLAAAAVPLIGPAIDKEGDEPFLSTIRDPKRSQAFLAQIPDGVEVYRIAGQVMFPYYSLGGGLMSAALMYVYKGSVESFDGFDLGTTEALVVGPGDWAHHPIVFDMRCSYREACKKLAKACAAVLDA